MVHNVCKQQGCIYSGVTLTPTPGHKEQFFPTQYEQFLPQLWWSLWSVAPPRSCGDKLLAASVWSFLQHAPQPPRLYPTSLAAMKSVCAVGWVVLAERLLTQLLSSRSEKYESTYNKNGCFCHRASIHEDFSTLRIQQPDCWKHLWEHTRCHLEPCLIWAVCTVLCTATAMCTF